MAEKYIFAELGDRRPHARRRNDGDVGGRFDFSSLSMKSPLRFGRRPMGARHCRKLSPAKSAGNSMSIGNERSAAQTASSTNSRSTEFCWYGTANHGFFFVPGEPMSLLCRDESESAGLGACPSAFTSISPTAATSDACIVTWITTIMAK